MAKDRARPFSRKHRRYWIPVTGGMIVIGLINVVIGYLSYSSPSEVHERIQLSVPTARDAAPVPLARPANCDPAVLARIDAELPGSTITACSPTEVGLVRNDHSVELQIAGTEITSIAESLPLAEIPADVMRAFAVAFPRTIPASATRRTNKGAPPVYELAFPPGAAHTLAILRADGSIAETR